MKDNQCIIYEWDDLGERWGINVAVMPSNDIWIAVAQRQVIELGQEGKGRPTPVWLVKQGPLGIPYNGVPSLIEELRKWHEVGYEGFAKMTDDLEEAL